jgi:hypothetical protein
MAVTAVRAETDPFRDGLTAFGNGQFAIATTNFQIAVTVRPASGTLVNLGLAEWRRGRAGLAIVAWERALWIEPSNAAARNNLSYARQVAEIADPKFAWYELVSMWLPAGLWALVGGLSLWLSVALMTLPGLLRWRRTGWQPAFAAASLGIFLLSLPGHIGILTRSKVGFIVEKKVPLRLTPTEDSERVATLGVGEPIRKTGQRGHYYLVQTQEGRGWIERRQVGMISP